MHTCENKIDLKSAWQINDNTYNQSKRRSREAVFTLGNGYIGCRGFFEEDQEGIEALGGIYMAGVFGLAKYKPWKGVGREFVNTPNFLHASIKIDGEQLLVSENNISGYLHSLDIRNGILKRSFVWTGTEGQKIEIEFERFISLADIHIAGQKIKITPIGCNPVIEIESGINANIRNLNEVSCEPLPIQPGNVHLRTAYQDENVIDVIIDEPELVHIVEGQQAVCVCDNQIIEGIDLIRPGFTGKCFKADGKSGKTIDMEKLIYVYTSRDDGKLPIQQAVENIGKKSYEAELLAHSNAWAGKWHIADIQIDGNDEDQRAIRYNIFQLIQACPENDPRLSIGARGLSGEMYEGCVFWDTEIFQMPFFVYINPQAAKNLLKFRYSCLPAAKEHAADNWFKGAMYPWQSSEKGIEQTPQGVGAYYAIHITADIAYAIKQYWDVTGDDEFIAEYGAEILIETARFWESRTYYNPVRNNYNILAVRGPNEYDVIVNNNVYTNMMAQKNIEYAVEAIGFMKEKCSIQWENLKEKLCFNNSELESWQKIINGMVIGYNKELDLYEEDDMYLHRVPLDMKRAKCTAKRIIDSTLPYEALPLYQVTKQSDVICLMNLLPWKFTRQQMINAWNFYEPRTVHDSSLSYSPHSIMAARLDMTDEAYKYFHRSAFLDIEDIQLNTISGLHFANFGGGWQSVIFGFAGLNISNGILCVKPNLPEQWDGIQFRILYKGNLINIKLGKKENKVILEKSSGTEVVIRLCDDVIKL